MKQILKRLFNHEILSREEACTLLLNITKETYNDTQIAALLAVFQMRGIRVEELIGFREALLSTRIPIDLSGYHHRHRRNRRRREEHVQHLDVRLLHRCRCGLSCSETRQLRSNLGKRCQQRDGTAWRKVHQPAGQAPPLYGDLQHGLPARPVVQSGNEAVAAVRKALEVRTVFNLLGPLINPCLPEYQLLGVADLGQMRLYTNTLQCLGIGFAVVNNLDGYDEISLTDDSR